MKKTIFVSMILGAFFIFSPQVLGAEPDDATEYGGWAEEEGYYQNNVESESERVGTSSVSSSATADHRARTETRTRSGGVERRVVATTIWGNNYHYTQAWLQHRITGSRSGTNRVWGFGSTVARSGWGSGELASLSVVQARSSYGR